MLTPNPGQAALIRRTFHLAENEPVPELTPQEGGITNHSFRFSLNGSDYIMREPGQDTEVYLNRYQEAEIYRIIDPLCISDEIVALEPETGRKISKFWNSARTCDGSKPEEVAACMDVLRTLHRLNLKAPHDYDLFRINRVFIGFFPETSWHSDHAEVQQRCMDMEPILARFKKYAILCHCDAVPENFLFIDEDKGPELRLIDWEYAGNHDPAIDVSMFCNSAFYDHEGLETLMRCYLEGQDPSPEFRLRVYGYLALIGLLFSNWAEYMYTPEFDVRDYGFAQYAYARDYSRRFWELLPEVTECD